MDHGQQLKVLVTGAAGRIGSAFFRYAGERYHFRLVDRPGSGLASLDPGDHETLEFDLSDAGACLEACEGTNVVVHLAADPSPEADFTDSLLPNNIVGSYNLFEAARKAGCRRVVAASSVHAVSGYPVDVQIRAEMPVRPKNLYGVSKCFLEALAAYYTGETGLSSCVVVRIGAYPRPDETAGAMSAEEDLSAFVSPRDLCQLLCQCVDAPDRVRFAVAHGVSDNRFKRLDLSHTREIFGYRPQDDAFRIHGMQFD